MTVPTEVYSVTYTGNGSTTVFPVPFVFRYYPDDSSQLAVTLDGVALVDGVDYTVAQFPTVATTDMRQVNGSVTLLVAPADGLVLTIARDLPYYQLEDLTSQAFRPSTHENALDMAVMLDQQLVGRIGVLETNVPRLAAFAAALPSLFLARTYYLNVDDGTAATAGLGKSLPAAPAEGATDPGTGLPGVWNLGTTDTTSSSSMQLNWSHVSPSHSAVKDVLIGPEMASATQARAPTLHIYALRTNGADTLSLRVRLYTWNPVAGAVGAVVLANTNFAITAAAFDVQTMNLTLATGTFTIPAGYRLVLEVGFVVGGAPSSNLVQYYAQSGGVAATLTFS